MSVIYLECAMGAAGDMLTAALLELHPDPKGFIEKLNNCGIPGTVIETETSVKCGISGTHMRVYLDGTEEHHHHHHGHTHHHSHEHMNVHEIEHIIGHLHIDNEVKNDVISVFNYLAEAEKHGRVQTVSNELPKSFIVCSDKNDDFKIYLSQISCSTLLKRTQEMKY